MSIDRRRHPRLRLEVPVDIDQGHHLYLGNTADISDGGIFVRTDAPIRVGASVRLHLTSGHHVITVIGRVAWRRRPEAGAVAGIGVQFTEMSPHARATLRALMRELTPVLHPLPPVTGELRPRGSRTSLEVGVRSPSASAPAPATVRRP